MSRYVSHPTAFLALGLVTLSACVDTDSPTEALDAGAAAEPAQVAAAPHGRIPCGTLGKVEIRDGKVVQDDMVYGTDDELAAICGAATPGPLFGVGIEPGSRKWPGGVIPYKLADHVPYNLGTRVADAITHWEGHTDINFVPYNPAAHDDWVEITTDEWCHSAVGNNGAGKQNVWLTDGKSTSEVKGVAIAANDWVYTWYSDGSVTAGTATNTDEHKAVYAYSLPPGYYAANIVEMAINSQDRVYTWWSDGKVSIGTSYDLDAYQAPQGNYSVASGKTRNMIVGIGISANDTVYTWYSDGTRSSGSSQNLGASAVGFDNEVPATAVLGVDISSNGIYTYYASGDQYRVVIGSLSEQADGPSQEARLPANCSLGTVIHELGHTVGLKHEHTRSDRDQYVRVFWDEILDDRTGNFEKAEGSEWADYGDYDFDSVMHYGSNSWRKNQSPTLLRKGTLGANLPDIVETAIAANDRVYTWWEDGTVTSGTSSDLELYRSRYTYDLPDGLTPANIEGIAFASDDRVFAFYDDGTVSIGTTYDLDAHQAPYDVTLAYKAPGVRYAADEILAVGISSQDHVYVWYEDGYASWGSSWYPGEHARYDVTSSLDADFDEIKGIDIAGDDTIYTWYETGRASKGTSDNLNSIGSPYDVRGRGSVLATHSVLSAGDIAAVDTMY